MSAAQGDRRLRWGILGPGKVARDFFAGASGSSTGVVTTLGTRSTPRPALLDMFPGARVVVGYDALVADPAIDAIYVATPHPMHAKWAIAAVERGKHVLCEKPMGMSAAEVSAMQAAATRSGVFLGEAFMYRLHPLTAVLIACLRAGRIGDVRMVRSSFGFALPNPLPEHRLFAQALGGGAILDVGGYPASMVRLIAGYCSDDGVCEPEAVQALAHVGPTGVDEWTVADLRFANGILAQISGSISVRQDNVLHVMGTLGRLEIDQFWFAGGKTGGKAAIRLILHDGSRETIVVDEPEHLYSFQFEAANAAIMRGDPAFTFPGMTRSDSLGNARLLDAWLGFAAEGRPARPNADDQTHN